jgi:hypothetical protein
MPGRARMSRTIARRISPCKNCVPVVHFTQGTERPRKLGKMNRSNVFAQVGFHLWRGVFRDNIEFSRRVLNGPTDTDHFSANNGLRSPACCMTCSILLCVDFRVSDSGELSLRDEQWFLACSVELGGID